MGLGPPGAGKTTLVASYLAARRLRALWYQLDAGNADPATLFHYLRLGATVLGARRRRPASRRDRALPLLTPEYLPDLATVTRRFFEALSRRLPRRGLLVFDDDHQAPADSSVHAVIRDGLAALPAGCGAIIVSRSEPPAVLARLRANRAMEILGWHELRLTAEEIRDLVHLLAPRRLPAETIETLRARAGGWPARGALDGGDEAAGLAAVRAAFALGREHGVLVTPWWRPALAARLCAKGLEAGIEVAHVQALVRRSQLVPESPPLLVERWPWPVEVFTLGPFEVRRDGKPLPLSSRAGRMPVALLKAIVAGGRRGVLASQLAESLWPDADGESAEVALATTLYRLRRLLGYDEAVQRREGRVWLDPRLCWVDALALEQLLERADGNGVAREAERDVARAVQLYEGAFLDGEERDPRVIAMRERLRGRLLAQLGRLGRHRERAGEREAALDWYRKAIEVDPCAEEAYQRLMAALARLGRRAEALAVYLRCREALAARLAVEPGPATEALHQALREGRTPD